MQSHRIESKRSAHILRGISISRDDRSSSLGLRLSSADDGRTVVQEIIADGPAFREGSLRVGDEVIAVNGNSVVAWKFEEVLQLLISTETIVLDVSRQVPPAKPQAETAPAKPSPLPGTPSAEETSGKRKAPQIGATAKKPRTGVVAAAGEKAEMEDKGVPERIGGSARTAPGPTGGVVVLDGAAVGKEGATRAPAATTAKKSVGAASSLNDPKPETKPPPASNRKASSPTTVRKKGRGAICLDDNCTKTRQHGTQGFCQRHWTEQVKEKATSNGRGFVGQRVANKFSDGVYYGTISSYNNGKSEVGALWHIDYDDGDAEDYDVRDLCKALSLYIRVKKSDKKSQDKRAEA